MALYDWRMKKEYFLLIGQQHDSEGQNCKRGTFCAILKGRGPEVEIGNLPIGRKEGQKHDFHWPKKEREIYVQHRVFKWGSKSKRKERVFSLRNGV